MFAKLRNPRFLLDIRPLLTATLAEALSEETTAESFRLLFTVLVDRLPGDPWARLNLKFERRILLICFGGNELRAFAVAMFCLHLAGQEATPVSQPVRIALSISSAFCCSWVGFVVNSKVSEEGREVPCLLDFGRQVWRLILWRCPMRVRKQ